MAFWASVVGIADKWARFRGIRHAMTYHIDILRDKVQKRGVVKKTTREC